MQLSKAIDLFIASVCAGKQNETPIAYRKKLRRLLADLGDREIEGLQAADLERFRVGMLTQGVKRRGAVYEVGPLSVWYVRGVLRVVKYFFKWCASEGYLPVDLGAGVKVPKRPQILPKAITQQTFDKLLAAAAVQGETWTHYRNVAFLCLLRDTGGRVGGLLSAGVDDVDLVAGTLVVKEKGDRVRVVFFNQASRETLRRWLDVRAALDVRSDALFVGKRGDRLTRSGAHNLLRRLAAAAGLEGVRYNPHAFRHAFARDSLRAGADLSEVSQLMGHSGIGVTGDYYARWLPSELQAVHKRTSPGASIKLDVIEGEGGE